MRFFWVLQQVAPAAFSDEANLTRFGPETYEPVQGKPTTYSSAFKAIDGPAKLVLQVAGIERAWIKVNGRDVVEAQNFSGNGEVIVDLKLDEGEHD